MPLEPARFLVKNSMFPGTRHSRKDRGLKANKEIGFGDRELLGKCLGTLGM